MRNIELSRITVINTGQDGINNKGMWAGANSIHDCVITNCGRIAAGVGVLSGIALMGSTARVFNNIVTGSGGPGIRYAVQNGPDRNIAEPTYGTFATFECEAFNNIVINNGVNTDVSGFGIQTNNQSQQRTQLVPKFYSNSVSGCRETGIRCQNNGEGGGFVQNNIALGNGAPQVGGFPASTNVQNNLIEGITAANCFVDEDSNLHLTAAGEAAALGCSGARGTAYSTTDIDGVTRSATPSLARRGATET